MPSSSRTVRGLTIATLVLLTGQGWTGDFVNLFAVFPSGPVSRTLGGFTRALINAGRLEVTHAILGVTLACLAIAIVIIALRTNTSRGVQVWTIVALLGVLSAAYGGISFVVSGFQNNGSSAQMGGSFIGSYASYFLVLYFNRR
jgi:heme A synthase